MGDDRGWTRRDVLGGLGLASAHALAFAFGCRAPARPTARAQEAGGELHGWLHDAVLRLAAAGLVAPHALAVARRRSVAAVDVLGEAVAHERVDAVVLSARDRDGARREQVTGDVSGDGIAAAARALAGAARAAPRAPLAAPLAALTGGPPVPDDAHLLDRARRLAARDPLPSSRIVYAATTIDIDDETRWSVTVDGARTERRVRVRRAIARVAWSGARPVTGEAASAWSGGVDDHDLTDDELVAAQRAALLLATPGAFDAGERAVLLEPGVAAALVDAAARALLTTAAARRPEVARRVALGAGIAAPAIALVDDPAAPGAYGGFAFDDEGAPAAPVALIDGGRVVGRLADRAGADAGLARVAGRGLRAGHTGPVEPAPSHLRLAAGAAPRDALLGDGYQLEGLREASVDPGSGRVIVAVARARELHGGRDTGRVYPDVELVGELGALLAAATGTSRETRTFSWRDDAPRWRSCEAPWLATRGLVRSRRSTP